MSFTIYLNKTHTAARLAVRSALSLDKWRDRPAEIVPEDWDPGPTVSEQNLSEDQRRTIEEKGFCIYVVGGDDRPQLRSPGSRRP